MPKKKSGSTRDEITQTAVRILIEEGHGALSIDNIAKSMGISKGNITYHFSNKSLIINALFDSLIDDLEKARSKAFKKFSDVPLERFSQYIDFEISLKRSRNYDVQSWETYAFSSHNRYVRKKVTEAINLSIVTLADMLAAIKSDLESRECHQIAVVINAMLRGMMLFIGSTRGNKKQHKELAASARRAAYTIAGLS